MGNHDLAPQSINESEIFTKVGLIGMAISPIYAAIAAYQGNPSPVDEGY